MKSEKILEILQSSFKNFDVYKKVTKRYGVETNSYFIKDKITKVTQAAFKPNYIGTILISDNFTFELNYTDYIKIDIKVDSDFKYIVKFLNDYLEESILIHDKKKTLIEKIKMFDKDKTNFIRDFKLKSILK